MFPRIIAPKITSAVIVVILLLGFGTYYFHRAEGWSYVDSFYFSTMTLTTVGYGDLAPTHDVTKIVTSVYAVTGIGVMFYVVFTLIGGYLSQERSYFSRIASRLHTMNESIRSRFNKKKRE
jgi:voltage-gated potassium channel Kch